MSVILRSVLMLVLSVSLLNAVEFIVKDVNRDDNKTSTWIALPYAFSSSTTGFTVGAVGIFHGFIQPQMTMVVTAFRGEKLPVEEIYGAQVNENEAYSKGAFVGISGVHLPFTKRVFLSFFGMRAYYPNQRLYLDGSNDSVQELEPEVLPSSSPIQTQGWNNWSYFDIRYVLPLGESKDQVLSVVETSRGIAVNRDNIGGGVPFLTGQTIASIKPFYNLFTADKLQPDAPQLSTNGLKFKFEHDNTDYPDNPLRGYSFSFQYAQDFGYGTSTQEWNSLEAEYSQYLEMPTLSWMRHNVLAFNVWSAYSPSWDKDKPYLFEDGSGEAENIDQGQPPMWEGARLGGFDRMRAYDSNRFSDKAAVYGAVEYRFIPQLNPMQDQKWSPIPIEWFQGVLFAEAGRVAPQYNLDLFKDMKYDVGFSIRALAATLPVRFEMAWGSEGSTMWVMLKQPF